MEKLQTTDETVPCLLCDKPLEKVYKKDEPSPWIDIEHDGPASQKDPWQGVSVHTSGNYGSQVLDMDSLFFWICDGCIIKNSHKMLYRARQDRRKADEVQNARDQFEQWLELLNKNNQEEIEEHSKPGSNYLNTIKPYFSL